MSNALNKNTFGIMRCAYPCATTIRGVAWPCRGDDVEEFDEYTNASMMDFGMEVRPF